MKFGIKQKILFVLVGGLALTTTLYAGLASYYTNQQNQESAFTALSRDLQAWQNDLRALTGQLQRVALSASSDIELQNQLKQLITFELNADERSVEPDAVETMRALSYVKAVSLNRLRLVMQTGGFSSIAAYTGGQLSHYVSASEAGMMVRKGNTAPVWAKVAIEADANLSVDNWPAWKDGQLPVSIAPAMGEIGQPTVSVIFPSPEFAAIDIAIPLQGVIEEDWVRHPAVSRIVLDLTVANRARDKEEGRVAAPSQPTTLAVLVFRKRIDQTVLQEIAGKTGKWPILFSPDGKHQLRLTQADLTPKALLQKAQALPAENPSPVIQQTVTTEQGSFYQALLPWQFDDRTHLILGLTSSRDSTLQNIRQTVTAILIAAGLILVLSIGVGIFWVGRFIDPIVALTNAVKRIGIKRSLESEQASGNRITAEELQPIDIKAPDEIGELSSAFNVMIAELRHSIETLEQRVQSRTGELRQQTLYLRTLIDTLPLWIWLKDTRRRYLATNQANADACGRTVDAMIGKSDEELRPPELAGRYRADDEEVMASQQRKTVEEPIAGANGVTWMETWRAPVLDEDGTVLGIVGAARNISERKAAEEAREKALAEAVRLARQRSEFLAQMSHELRTPLNAILGYAQILQRDKQRLTPRQAAGLTTIQESGQHLLTLINDILDLARVEAGKLALYPANVELAAFLRVVSDVIRVKAEEKSLMFVYIASPDLPASVVVDDKRLRQVLLNLLGNAVKFTDEGEITLRVQRAHSGRDREGHVRLRVEVQDSGIGMSREQQARLFQPFEQVGEVRRHEGGTGLGLAISQQLVHLMGGTIQVSSEPGKGSLFWFELELPIGTGIAADKQAARVLIGYEGRRRKVLVVDDAPQNRAMLMDTLQLLGFEVCDAANGQECLDQLPGLRPDLILMDVMMPVMDGREATRRIRAMPEFAAIPVITVSARAGREEEAKSRAAGASACLSKPIEQEALLTAIGEQLSLTWMFEEATQEPDAPAAQNAEAFIPPPQEEIERLYHLARMGVMREIIEQAEHLRSLDPRYAPFADMLQNLARNYQSKAILALVARYRTAHEAAGTEHPQV